MDEPGSVNYSLGMLWRRLLWLFLGLAAGGLPAAQAQPFAPDIRLKHGDDPRWAAPDWDDSDWTPIKPSEFPARQGIFWVRIRMAPPDRTSVQNDSRHAYFWSDSTIGGPIDALFWTSVYSFELFLDGQRLASGGVLGHDKISEQTGPFHHLVPIPESLRGRERYVLAVRMSTYHYNFPTTHFTPRFQLVNFEQGLRQEFLLPVFPLICAVGSLLMAATSLILLRFIERRRALWLVSMARVCIQTSWNRLKQGGSEV